MGMSASQARYLSLIARQSNLEYQGQQINQERSILSQQVSDLYNSLLAMEVPTPPSTQDYTKVVYSATDGATNYKFDASDVKPGKDNTYSVVLSTTEYGQSLQQNKGYAITEGGTEKVVGKTLTKQVEEKKDNGAYEVDPNYIAGNPRPEGNGPFVKNLGTAKPSDMNNIYIDVDIDGNGESELVAINDNRLTDEQKNSYFGDYFLMVDDDSQEFDPNDCLPVVKDTTTKVVDQKITAADLSNLYIINSDNTLKEATINEVDVVKDSNGNVQYYTLKEGINYFLRQAGGEEAYNLPVTTNEKNSYTIAGKNAMTLDYAKEKGYITAEQYSGYRNAIANAAINSSSGSACTPEDFYVYFDADKKIHFALKTDVQDGNGGAVTYDYIANGEFEKPVTYDGCKLKFDVSSGRITTIDIPTYNSDGNIVSYKSLELEASTETDSLAYNEAMEQYKYAQHLYDKEQQEINKKTEIIQQQDRNLELKLERLDTERTQITTEIEALEKVITDNIEASYKTFSG